MLKKCASQVTVTPSARRDDADASDTAIRIYNDLDEQLLQKHANHLLTLITTGLSAFFAIA
jgi:hypothetical protein